MMGEKWMKQVAEGMQDFYRRLTKDGYNPDDVKPALYEVERIVHMEQLRRQVLSCTDCSLCGHAKSRVPGTPMVTKSIYKRDQFHSKSTIFTGESKRCPLIPFSNGLSTLINAKSV